MRGNALHDGGKLDVMASYLLEEIIEVQRIVGVVVIDHCHSVPFHTVFFQQVDALHHLDKRGLALLVLPVFVMELLGPVYGDTHQPVVLLEEPAPFIGQQRAVGLYAVVYGASVGIFLLQLHGTFVERERTHQRLSAMPGEQNLGHGLRVDVLLDELFQQFLAHHMLGVVSI